MQQFVCHKRVWGFKIGHIVLLEVPETSTPDGAVLWPEDASITAPLHVSQEYVDKHKPQAGGYYVRYEDGYESWSPASAFENGYARETQTADLDKWFVYHPPTADQAERYARIRATARSFAAVIIALTPRCADQTAAIRKVREAVMTANAAIACEEA